MVPLGQLTTKSILEDKIFEEIFEQEDEIYKARLILSLQDRAAELGVKAKFEEILKAYKRVDREMKRNRMKQPALLDNWTNFEGPYDNQRCRQWIASEDGVYLKNPTTDFTDILACYHPILPIERLKNLETGEEQLKIAYKRNGIWSEIIVPKTMVTSASKIVSLSGRGIAVTSEMPNFWYGIWLMWKMQTRMLLKYSIPPANWDGSEMDLCHTIRTLYLMETVGSDSCSKV